MLYRKIEAIPEQEQDQARQLSRDTGISPLLAEILVRRKITEPNQIKEFLEGVEQPYLDPFMLLNMDKAVDRILRALEQKEPITVYGDYDVDGTTASSLLYRYLTGEGAKIKVYIPRRVTEGYGLNSTALETLAAGGTTLLVTVDTGISGYQEVAGAPSSMDIIVTDHHLPPSQLPPAYAVVNPNQPGDQYPNKGICGVGVALKLCQALYQRLHHTQEYWDELIELVSLGTVADMVPLLGENREIVRRGLAKMRKTSLPGLKALLDVSISPDAAVNAGTIGFGLGPRINAAGRLDDAMAAVQLLTTDDPKKAQSLAQELNTANQERQAISQEIFQAAEEQLSQLGSPEWGIVLGAEGWHPGVIGIVASRITEKYHLPSVLLSIQGETAKGSCRGIPPLQLYNALQSCKEYLLQFGGHAQAAGLTLETRQLPAFRQAFQAAVKEQLQGIPYQPSLQPDYFVPEGMPVDEHLVEELDQLAPFGMGNPSPVLGFAKAKITEVALLGRDKTHLKLTVAHGSSSYKGLLWKAGDQYHTFYGGEQAVVAFSPRLNVFRGKTSVDLEVCGVMSPYTILDWRQDNTDRKTLLQGILQEHKKTVVYVQDMETQAALSGKAQVLIYGEPLPKEAEVVVFYDSGARRVMNPKDFPLGPDQPALLYLLYDRDELVAEVEQLRRQYPDLNGMRRCYAALRKMLRENPALPVEQVLGQTTREGYLLGSQVLAVFCELNLLHQEKGLLSMGETTRKNMQDSVRFQEMRELYREKFEELNRLWKLPAGEIAEFWSQGR